MAIKFACENCGKSVSAPNEAGGKRGQCPFCKQSVYIPMPPEDAGEIPLAPLDDSEEQRVKKMREEDAKLRAFFDREGRKELPPEPDEKNERRPPRPPLK